MWGWLFGGSNSANKVVETGCGIASDISSGFDVLVFTDEEKEQYRQKGIALYFDWLAKQRDENSVRAVARRLLAFMYTFVFVVACLCTIGCILFGCKDRAESLLLFMEHYKWIITAIISFYFLPSLAERAIESFKGKKSAA